MRVIYVLTIVISYYLILTKSSKILCIFPFPSLSHHLTYRPIINQLSRHHEITVVTTHPLFARNENVEEIDVSYVESILQESNIHKQMVTSNSFFDLLDTFLKSSDKISEELYKRTLTFLIDENRQYDLIIGEPTYPAWYAIVDVFKCPLVLISPIPVTLTTHDSLGDPTHPVLYPDLNLPFVPRSTGFVGRLVSSVYVVYMRYLMWRKHFPRQEAVAKRHLGARATRKIAEIQDNVDLVMVQTVPGFHPTRPTVPAYVELHGLNIEGGRRERMSKELQDFVDRSAEGIVYVSFGSLLTASVLPNGTAEIVLEALVSVPYKIVWKYDGSVSGLSEARNVMVDGWYPQQDVLRHKNTKLFITHCGQQSISESLTFGVPMIGIPFFGDQFQNALRIEEVGAGVYLDKNNLNPRNLREAILEVAENPRYRRRAVELADIAADQPMKSVDKAVWWIEYVLRHNGAEHLRSRTVDTPFYQYFLLDVGALLIFILVAVWFIVRTTFRLIYYLVKSMRSVLFKRKSKLE